jgi:hypothetical protein
MDGRFLAGLVVGAILGGGLALAVVAWRKWRGAIAAVPAARAEAFGRFRELAVLVAVCSLAACTALKMH